MIDLPHPMRGKHGDPTASIPAGGPGCPALAAGVLATLLIAWVHYRTGVAYEFHLLFLAPVVIMTWRYGPTFGMLQSLLSSGAWFVVDRALLLGQASSALAISINWATRTLSFSLMVVALAKVRELLIREAGLARTDRLTGLLNRRGFNEAMQRLLAYAVRNEVPVAVLFIDIDGFKQVNDTRGHKTGDQVLQAVAAALGEHSRESDVISRIGGDEFVAVLLDTTERTSLDYAQKRIGILSALMRARGWPVTFSIGIAYYKRPKQTLERMLQAADALMYEVKRNGKNAIRLAALDD